MKSDFSKTSRRSPGTEKKALQPRAVLQLSSLVLLLTVYRWLFVFGIQIGSLAQLQLLSTFLAVCDPWHLELGR